MRIKSLYVAGFLALLLGGCKGSADAYEEAYENGVEEGAMEVCLEVKDISEDVYRKLKSRRYC